MSECHYFANYEQEGHRFAEKRYAAGIKAEAYFLWHPSLHSFHCFCFIPFDARQPRQQYMEQPVLGHTIICLRECSCQKFFAGKPWQDALFLFHRFAGRIYYRQTVI